MGSPLLQFTRYVEFTAQGEQEVTPELVKLMLPGMSRYVKEKYVEEVQEGVGKKTATRKEVAKLVYTPPGTTVLTQTTKCITGALPITATHRANLVAFVLPIID